MTDSEFLKVLTSTEAIELTVKDQKTGRSSSRLTLLAAFGIQIIGIVFFCKKGLKITLSK
jgi:hypothetical protein